MVEIKIGDKTRFENLIKQMFHSPLLDIYIYLIRRFGVKYRCIFLRVVQYFDEPVGRVRIQTTSKNIQRYYTPKRLIRDLLSNDLFSKKF